MTKLVLFSGKINSGKNQVASYFEEFAGDSCMSDYFAKGLKDGACEDFGALAKLLNELSRNIAYYITVAKSKCSDRGVHDDLDSALELTQALGLKDENFYEDKTEISRVLLQLYGSEIFRHRVDDEYWVKDFVTRVMSRRSLKPVDFIFCTDCRYPNEIISTKDLVDSDVKVFTVRIERPALARTSAFNRHPSETALDKFRFDHVIYNEGTLDDLYLKAKEIFNRLKDA